MSVRFNDAIGSRYRTVLTIICLATLFFSVNNASATTLEDCQYIASNYQTQYPYCSVSSIQYSDGFQNRCKIAKYCAANVCRTETTYTADVLPGYSNYHTTLTTKCSGDTATSSGPGSIYCGDPYFGYLCGDPYLTSSPYVTITDSCATSCTVTLADYAIDTCASSSDPCCGDPTCGSGIGGKGPQDGSDAGNAGGPDGDCSNDEQ